MVSGAMDFRSTLDDLRWNMRVVEEQGSGSCRSDVLRSENAEKHLCGPIPRGAEWASFANVLCGKARALTMGQVIGLGMDTALTAKSAVRVTV